MSLWLEESPFPSAFNQAPKAKRISAFSIQRLTIKINPLRGCTYVCGVAGRVGGHRSLSSSYMGHSTAVVIGWAPLGSNTWNARCSVVLCWDQGSGSAESAAQQPSAHSPSVTSQGVPSLSALPFKIKRQVVPPEREGWWKWRVFPCGTVSV